ncbi:ARM repeat-containing protein [Polychaeton citri CBS 116435]|uniref:ARM repeat-containing protein n=1 Tax=Polychaeton citri CBS 116435 TaxID=1314669 RepID=A0A9P4QIU4_9PEZI|nr:ARM repeat-containing protein [Polychaeton citri CBS 116435]
MASTTQSTEQRELTLVGKVEMRIALAEGDNQIQNTLKTYLAPLLLKLASEHASVRNKVISICQHVNTRIKPQSIQLPVATLAKQFKEQQSSLIRHFDLLYIQRGVGRLSTAEQAELLPVVANGIAASGSHAPAIFNLLLRLLESFPLPQRGSNEDAGLRERVGLSDDDAQFLAEWVGKLILFATQKNVNQSCPGLSADDISFLTLQGREETWKPGESGLNLLKTKVSAAKLMASGLFNDKERFYPALFASADTAFTVSDVGDDMMKRALPATNLEEEDLVSRLFKLYFGEGNRTRVRAPLRLKILGLLGKSTHSTTFSGPISRLVDDGISVPVKDGEDLVMSNGTSTGFRADQCCSGSTNAGREASKLRASIFSYINYVARYGSKETLSAIAPSAVSKLRDFIEVQGWPRPATNEDLVSRGYAYEVIGLLAKSGGRNILVEEQHPTLDLLRWLFSSLAKDSSGSSIIVSVEEALSTCLTALARLDLTQAEQSALEDLLMEQMEQSDDLEANQRLRSTRYVGIRFANRCLPYSSVKARWIDCIGIGATGDRVEVREEAERGLSPYWYKMLNGSLGSLEEAPVTYPDFTAVTTQFFAGRTIDDAVEPSALAQYAAKRYHHSFSAMTRFARRILYTEVLQTSGLLPDIDSEWERSIDAAVEMNDKARIAVKSFLKSLPPVYQTTVKVLLCAQFEAMLLPPPMTADDSLADFLAISSDDLTQTLLRSSSRLMPNLSSNDVSRRKAAAHAFGILSSHPASNQLTLSKNISELLVKARAGGTAIGAAINQAHGATVALGYYFSRSAFRTGADVLGSDCSSLLTQAIDYITVGKDKLLQEAGMAAIGQLAMFAAIPTDFVMKTKPSISLKAVVDSICSLAREGSEPAILCLGQLSMIFPEEDDSGGDLGYIKEQIHKLHEIQQAELHFTVGEALSYVSCAWRSQALATKLDVEGATPTTPARTKTLSDLLEQTLKDCTKTKPSLKKASVMWLLCLVEFCGAEVEVQERLGLCQVAFKRCLSDRDELVQETASRGLGLVYQKGDRGLKDDLVRDLVMSFSSDSQTQLAGNVSADTQLFEPGALPTGDGSISTYKDIMNLAAEVGDSSLVYRFMSMASSNAVWSSRAAFGRFGLSNVLSDSSVDGYLADNPKLYPKLYRYRFDPHGGVQRSMNDIWNALVKDSVATIDKHFDAIMEDLLKSILGREWRVRQASCAAISDLVQGRSIDKYEQYLERIWTQCFRVLDDIKESVRDAAAGLARVLTGVLTRTLEAGETSSKNAQAMLHHVLPFLLSPSGVESGAEEVRLFAVHTLLELIKKGGAQTLRPFVPELVGRLIGLLSTLEPEAVNYLHLNAAKYNLTGQKIDDMRLSNVRASPLMEAIERCLDMTDDETMAKLSPTLESAMKGSLGLPSKVGSSRVLVSLSTRRAFVFRPYADTFLKLIERLVLDRNETVESSYAASAGYLARLSSDKQIIHLVDFAKKLYFQSEGDRESSVPRRSITAGELLLALVRNANDRFNALSASILPFVFVAVHDSSEAVKQPFQETWNEAVGGSRAVSLYLAEILQLAGEHLDSPQWVLKHTAARTVGDAVNSIAAMSKDMPADDAAKLWPLLERSLGGKTWEGKEEILPAFVKFVETSTHFLAERSDIRSSVVKVCGFRACIAVREAKRQNEGYKSHAIKAIGQIARSLREVDLSESIFEIVHPLLCPIKDDEDMDIDDSSTRKSEERREQLVMVCVDGLLSSINPYATRGAALEAQILRAVDTNLAVLKERMLASVQRSIMKGLHDLFDRIKTAGHGHDLTSRVLPSLKGILIGEELVVESLRLQRADALVTLVEMNTAFGKDLLKDLDSLLRVEVSKLVKDRLNFAIKQAETH